MSLSRVKVWGNEVLYPADLNAEFDNILTNAASLISPLGGALDWDGYAHTLDAAGVTTAQSTAAIGWAFTPGNKTGTPSTTGGITNYAASTWTDSNTAGSGTAASWVGHAFQRPTLAATNSSVTTTNAATVYIPNAPLAGSNQTLTNPWALWIDAGNVRFDDDIYWLSGTAFNGILAHNNSAARTYTFPDATGDIPTIATQAEVNAMTSTATGLTPNHNKIVLYAAAATATTSGTSIDFTSIPSGVRRVTLTLVGVSTNGTSIPAVQIGPVAGVETSGYLGTATDFGTSANYTARINLTASITAASVFHGRLVFDLVDSSANTWVYSGHIGRSDSAATGITAGSKSLAGVLSVLRLTTVNGTDTFDAGSANISYER